MRSYLLAITLAALCACAAGGNPKQPIPTRLDPGAGAPDRLVVILPGRADDLKAMERAGIAQAVHDAWPDADVQLVALTLPYYLRGDAPSRLHEEVIAPARKRGYREIWLGGASMGGMGTLLYDAYYPGSVDGLILLAPYLGDRSILKEIRGAGGVQKWMPGPVQPWSAESWQREMWRHIQGWSLAPEHAPAVWLAYGDSDRLRAAMPVLEPALPANHILVRPGGHDWPVWTAALRELLRAQAEPAGTRVSPL